jgi:hypothetical protein
MAGNRDNVVVGPATLCVDGADMGLTTGGINIRYEREFVETEADQLIGIAKRSLQTERVYVATTLLEQTLENLRIVLGLPNDALTGGTKLCLGYNSSCGINEHAITVKGPGPGCGCRTFVFDAASSIGSFEYNQQRTQEVQVAVEFEVFKDPVTGQFGCITDGCTFRDAQACT